MSASSDRSLHEWVDYIQTLHHREIELSLDRVREVYLRLYPAGLQYKVLSLAGTNGKGSTAELLASIYRQAGYKVGKFTSPHLVHFNERFNLNGDSVDDQSLLAAFERIEAQRLDTPITFFEYSTLLAIEVFTASNVDVAIMEVGLGGRLDSVNILDADASIVTSISIDHTSWLGDTIEKIAFEKVGIARKGKPLVLGLPKPPETMLNYAIELGAKVSRIYQDFSYECAEASEKWRWVGQKLSLKNLPLPYQQGNIQLSNCSLAIEAIQQLQSEIPVTNESIISGIGTSQILGRCQVVSERPYVVLDVSHNEMSVAYLSHFLETLMKRSSGRTVAVCGMLLDKEIQASLEKVQAQIDQWYVTTIHNQRGACAAEISAIIASLSESTIKQYDRVQDAYDSAFRTLTADDCLVVFGSFHIVGDILEHVN